MNGASRAAKTSAKSFSTWSKPNCWRRPNRTAARISETATIFTRPFANRFCRRAMPPNRSRSRNKVRWGSARVHLTRTRGALFLMRASVVPRTRVAFKKTAALIPACPPGTRLATLDNGLTIIVREDHTAPVVSAQAWCMSGSIHEGRWLGAGLSHVLEHMLFKGTATRPGVRIDQEVQEAGGYINAYTSFDRTV